MLTRILLGYMLQTAVVVIGVATAVGFMVGGTDLALGIAVGGALVGGSGAVQIWLVGILFDPTQGTPQKLVTGIVLVLKLVLVGGILWWVLTRTSPHQIGLLIGMGLGVASLVIGVNRGSASREGQRAMDEASRQIAENMEETDDREG